MMNILDIQDKLKSLSQDQLANEMQMPSGAVPQFLVLGELNRRQSMRQSMQQQGAGAQTVAQELLNGAGVPSEGMSEMGRSMAPKSSIAQNTGIGSLPQQAPPPEQGAGIAALAPQQPMGMYGGGVVKLQAGTDEERRAEIIRNRNNIFRGIGSANDYVTNTVDQLVFGLPLAGVETAATALGDVGAGITGMIPGMEGISMGLYDMAGQSAENADRYMREGLFPDNPYYQTKPDSHGSKAEPEAPNNKPNWMDKINAPELLKRFAAIDAERAAAANAKKGNGSSGAGGAGPMSSYEKMLQDAMANAEKKAKQDKWLALAQAGMALMSSTSGSFAGALGEAGKVGIEALQGSRDVAEQNKLKLGQEMFGIEQARAAQARAAATSGQRRAPTAKDLMSQLNDVQEFINTINPPPDGISEPRVLSPAEQASIDEAMAIRDALVQAIGQMGVGAADLSDPAQ